MRRNATYLLASLAIALTLIVSGCKSTKKKETSWNPTFDMTESYADASSEASYEPESYPVYGAATPVETTTTYEPPPTTPAVSAASDRSAVS